jgi:prevent-host-death family protein
MKTTSIRDFRRRIADLIDGDESVLVTRHGKPAAVLYPLQNPSKVPVEVRRKLYMEMSSQIAKQLKAKGVTERKLDRDFEEHKKRRRR